MPPMGTAQNDNGVQIQDLLFYTYYRHRHRHPALA